MLRLSWCICSRLGLVSDLIQSDKKKQSRQKKCTAPSQKIQLGEMTPFLCQEAHLVLVFTACTDVCLGKDRPQAPAVPGVKSSWTHGDVSDEKRPNLSSILGESEVLRVKDFSLCKYCTFDVTIWDQYRNAGKITCGLCLQLVESCQAYQTMI